MKIELTPQEVELLKQTVDQFNFPGSVSHIVTTIRQKLLASAPKEEVKDNGGDKAGDKGNKPEAK